MALGSFLDKAKDASSGLTDKATSLKGAAENKINEILADFNKACPHISQAGYGMKELEVEIGLPPKIIVHFGYSKQPEEVAQAALVALEGNNLGKNLLTGLTKAGELQSKLHVANVTFTAFEVELGLMPEIKLKFLPS